MKKVLVILFCLFLIAGCCSCGDDSSSEDYYPGFNDPTQNNNTEIDSEEDCSSGNWCNDYCYPECEEGTFFCDEQGGGCASCPEGSYKCGDECYTCEGDFSCEDGEPICQVETASCPEGSNQCGDQCYECDEGQTFSCVDDIGYCESENGEPTCDEGLILCNDLCYNPCGENEEFICEEDGAVCRTVLGENGCPEGLEECNGECYNPCNLDETFVCNPDGPVCQGVA